MAAIVGVYSLIHPVQVVAAILSGLWVRQFVRGKPFKADDLTALVSAVIIGFMVYKSIIGVTLVIPLVIIVLLAREAIKKIK